MAHVSQLVKKNFKDMFSLITLPFTVVTIPLVVFSGYLVQDKLNGNEVATKELSRAISILSISVARLEEKTNKGN